MRSLSFSLCVVLAACGSPTEPTFPSGQFNLVAVNGVQTDAPFDASSCANWYEAVSYLRLTNGSAFLHARTHPNCRSGENLFEDTGTYAIAGSAITVTLSRASVPFHGTVSSNQDTLSLDFRDVWNPDSPTTARFTFVR